MSDPIIRAMLEEQAASLRASAAQFDMNRAAALASAQDYAVQAGGARTQAAKIEASLAAYDDAFPPPPEEEIDPEAGS
ncbi:hypothetical protein O1W71_01895 [Microbacterium sp. H37-C3]|uniref:hypothetical protein n=1 Tax=Microbacterium sp. H37-C3 TaxID=3004354 RepID=UPI0022AF91DF|nr:hypothetical protein [Microbacterium sp. H37-C3]MCZ4066420.1 hypothetical protein [Microbacterium sp. H37-C3]